MRAEKYNRYLYEAIIVLVGIVVLLGITNTKGSTNWLAEHADVFTGLAIAIIAAGVLAILESAFRTDIESMLEPDLKEIHDRIRSATHRMVAQSKMYDFGLVDILTRRDLDVILNSLGTADSIDMSFNTARSLIMDHSEQLKRLIRKGCKIRLLITDPTNAYWETDVVREAQGPDIKVKNDIDSITDRIKKWKKDWSQSPEKVLGSLEIKMFKHVPTCSIVIAYDRDEKVQRGKCWVTPYVPYENSSHVPTFVMMKEMPGRRGEPSYDCDLFSEFKKAFDNVWNSPHEPNTDCPDISILGDV